MLITSPSGDGTPIFREFEPLSMVLIRELVSAPPASGPVGLLSLIDCARRKSDLLSVSTPSIPPKQSHQSQYPPVAEVLRLQRWIAPAAFRERMSRRWHSCEGSRPDSSGIPLSSKPDLKRNRQQPAQLRDS